MAVTFVRNSWTDSIITRLQRDVTTETNTTTIHPISGEETLTDGTSTTTQMVFFKTDQKWMFDKEGMIEGGDAFGVTSSTTTFTRNDKITVNNETYRVHDKISYYSDSSNAIKLYTYYNLYKVE